MEVCAALCKQTGGILCLSKTTECKNVNRTSKHIRVGRKQVNHPFKNCREMHKQNSPVGIREGDEGELFGAVQDQVFCHLAEMSGTQGGPEQELRWQNTDKLFWEKKPHTFQEMIPYDCLLTNKVPLACSIHAVQTDVTEVQLCTSRWGDIEILSLWSRWERQ